MTSLRMRSGAPCPMGSTTCAPIGARCISAVRRTPPPLRFSPRSTTWASNQGRSRLAAPGRAASPRDSSAPHAATSWAASSSSTRGTCSAFWPASLRTTSTTGRTCPWRRTHPRCESWRRSRIPPPRSSLCLVLADFIIATPGRASYRQSANSVLAKDKSTGGLHHWGRAHQSSTDVGVVTFQAGSNLSKSPITCSAIATSPLVSVALPALISAARSV